MKKNLLISVHGRTKDYKNVYVLCDNNAWVELFVPYWVREMTRSQLRCWLQSKFSEYSVKFTFSR